MKNIFVTGGAGFIGSHIVDMLVEKGHDVTVYDNLSSGHRDYVNPGARFVAGNILDYERLHNSLRYGFDEIYHLAAQLEITTALANPLIDLRINTEGTINVLNAARANNVEKVTYASSACVYGNHVKWPTPEYAEKLPNWPYGISKLACEHYARLYNELYGIATTGIRYSIVYGPREWYGRVLPVFIKRAVENKPCIVWNSGVVRDFVYVKDAAKATIMATDFNDNQDHIYNVGSGTFITIPKLAQTVHKIFRLDKPYELEKTGQGEYSEEVGRARLINELDHLVLDNTLIKDLGWMPSVDLELGILTESRWYQLNRSKWDRISY